jgi:hypothetical protein
LGFGEEIKVARRTSYLHSSSDAYKEYWGKTEELLRRKEEQLKCKEGQLRAEKLQLLHVLQPESKLSARVSFSNKFSLLQSNLNLQYQHDFYFPFQLQSTRPGLPSFVHLQLHIVRALVATLLSFLLKRSSLDLFGLLTEITNILSGRNTLVYCSSASKGITTVVMLRHANNQ